MLTVRVQPKASRARIDGFATDEDGKRKLRLRVTAVPDKGRANKAVIALLAAATGLPKSAVSIIAGDKSRTKTVRLEADPDMVLKRLADASEG